ncbi:hypothetical protein R3L02_42205 [Streptomyces scabiei]|uniref:hypothetical protein n=1 Tax=Streptomyces scabiei TaxID=1930 RepID=UPI00298EF3BB|nr:hypothetical protein [Streptomyces scabiei]MDW8478364.1 hypothetical protein [Streptomyces scabiei]
MTHEALSVPEVAVARYAAPRVRALPVTEVITAKPLDGRRPGHYQQVLLDTRSGELRFHEIPEKWEPWNPAWASISDVPRETYNRWHPGKFFSGVGPHQWFEPVPELLSWTIDSGVEELPYLDVDDANALLQELTPYAQALLDSLFDAGGDLDWSADSGHAGRNITRLCKRDRKAAGPEADADLVDYGTIVARFPQVYRPNLLRRSLDELADGCESITRYLGANEPWHEEIKKVFGVPYEDGSGVSLDVLGVRAWYRSVLMDGDPRPLKEFTDWDAEHGRLAAGDITSTSTDAELDRWADREEESAARQGWRLLGAREAASAHRDHLRARGWDRLAILGADIAELENSDSVDTVQKELESTRQERRQLVSAAIGWGRTDSEIAIRARVPRLTVNELRDTVDAGQQK